MTLLKQIKRSKTMCPVKNGDDFERLGIRTTLADRKGTVEYCDCHSSGDDCEMTYIHGIVFFDEGG